MLRKYIIRKYMISFVKIEMGLQLLGSFLSAVLKFGITRAISILYGYIIDAIVLIVIDATVGVIENTYIVLSYIKNI